MCNGDFAIRPPLRVDFLLHWQARDRGVRMPDALIHAALSRMEEAYPAETAESI